MKVGIRKEGRDEREGGGGEDKEEEEEEEEVHRRVLMLCGSGWGRGGGKSGFGWCCYYYCSYFFSISISICLFGPFIFTKCKIIEKTQDGACLSHSTLSSCPFTDTILGIKFINIK